jgi:uracil-DNA glycosylase family 4
MDENTRRYYLETMGIQCWQLLDNETPGIVDRHINNAVQPEGDSSHSDRDVAPVLQQAAENNWQRLETDVQQCNKCQLHKTRKQAILGRGNQSAALMIILLAPDMIDDTSGQLCDSAAYQLLSKMLSAIDIAIDDVYITSLLKCGAPVMHSVSLELQQCNEYLKQQIQLIQPRQLAVLGETAARCLLQNDKPLDNLRAMFNAEEKNNSSIPARYESIPMLVSYSPQELLQQPENKRKAWLDLQQLQKMMQGR